ncbi:class E sortase [Nonomuraea basaltis]|uniref:class E sortase n=1 Tax=Nonomuraea basaltis TaxID=2495887 RepID=UPI00110C4CE7|nr:class E sortase [Nonomuraea basaltis]TMR99401.1 class E sortase [Nonomuraea basaltis]
MRAMLRAVGETSITAGLILMLFSAYLLWGTGSYTQSQQTQLQRELKIDELPADESAGGKTAEERSRLGKIRLGEAVALLRIPKLGRHFRYAVVEGTGIEELKKGPGHYTGSAMPGQLGNFVVSGHRTTYGAPFNEIDELESGDEIIVDAREARYTYRVVSQDIVRPDETDVIAPVPGKPNMRPVSPFITLTTCHPEYSDAQRLIVYGMLDRTEPRKE